MSAMKELLLSPSKIVLRISRFLQVCLPPQRPVCLQCTKFDIRDKRQIDAYWMRPTKGAALSLISRLRLYAASPLYNGNNQFYSNWKNVDGSFFINQNADNEKWAKAAVAAYWVIQLAEEKGIYSLYIKSRKDNSPILAPNVDEINVLKE